MAPEDMASVLGKCRESGCEDVILCERGTEFGYHELSVDFRSLPVMRSLGVPVMFDATHSVQKPGGKGTCSGGDRSFVLPLIRAAGRYRHGRALHGGPPGAGAREVRRAELDTSREGARGSAAGT